MTEKVFVDTNLLVYYYSEDEPEKSVVVKNILQANKVVVSSQIINEFSYVMLKKFEKSPQLIKEIIEKWKVEFNLKALRPVLTTAALDIHERYKFSFWDCLVIAAAIDSKCRILYTEDLQHNQFIGGRLRILNPFLL
jgi:predicted nucleic acid-binding protein